MAKTAAERRAYAGPALLSYGFRPFFLGAAAWAALGMLAWLPQYFGDIVLATAFGPIDWHIHEMLFGYVGAVVAGFLLTAIPNWTGRLPVQGTPLAALVGLWLAGRIAVAVSAHIGALLTAIVDVAFLAGLAGVAAREIVAGKNWRNLRVLILIAVLVLGNLVFHIEAATAGAANYGTRIGLAGAIGLLMLVGGRIIPSFTHNWLARQGPGRMPVAFAAFDAFCLAAAAVALLIWTLWPEHAAAGGLLIMAGLLHAARLSRWAGERTFSDRLVLVLHAGYAFVPFGFLLVGAAALWPGAVPKSAGIHAWTAGAVGLMTTAVMTRASLGHTGQALRASPATQAIYALVLLSAVTRIAAAFGGAVVLLHVSALAWIAAFAGFVLAYGPALLRRRAW